MPNLVAELNSLDFSVYIGGPLQAAVQAQHAASMSQVNFIQTVGFETDPNVTPTTTNPNPQKLRYVDFAYAKSVANPNYNKTLPELIANGTLPTGSTAIPTSIDTTHKFIDDQVVIKVPFLTMLTMPAIRIEEITIDFNAKLTSTETSSVSSEFAASAELGVNFSRVNFKASASHQRKTANGTSVEKTYNMGVHVRAVNDEMPAGLDRILTMLEDSITSINEKK
jgi:hypothetical protein